VLVSLILKTLDKSNEMESRLQNYAVINPTENICKEFNNNKLNGLQSCDIAQNYIILHRVAFVPTYPHIFASSPY
jgi:hypothetical protein